MPRQRKATRARKPKSRIQKLLSELESVQVAVDQLRTGAKLLKLSYDVQRKLRKTPREPRLSLERLTRALASRLQRVEHEAHNAREALGALSELDRALRELKVESRRQGGERAEELARRIKTLREEAMSQARASLKALGKALG